jgi:hypothetical protein
MQPTTFFAKIGTSREKEAQTLWASTVIYKQQPKVNNRPLGENSLNLVSLTEKSLEKYLHLLSRCSIRVTNRKEAKSNGSSF